MEYNKKGCKTQKKTIKFTRYDFVKKPKCYLEPHIFVPSSPLTFFLCICKKRKNKKQFAKIKQYTQKMLFAIKCAFLSLLLNSMCVAQMKQTKNKNKEEEAKKTSVCMCVGCLNVTNVGHLDFDTLFIQIVTSIVFVGKSFSLLKEAFKNKKNRKNKEFKLSSRQIAFSDQIYELTLRKLTN